LESNFKGSRSYLEETLKVFQKYKPGAPVKVCNDPENPSDSVVEKGYQGYIPTYLIFSSLAIGFGIYGLIKD